jgi:hypothetical protein
MSGKVVLCIVVSAGISALRCGAAVYQSDGSAASVQGLHNAAVNGDTITLPAGTFTWSTPVTISKAVHLRGQGSGRIIGNTKSSATIGTGTKTFMTTRSGLPITVGQTLRIAKMPSSNGLPARENYVEGTVTSYSGTTLVMNITRTGGSGTWKFWWIATRPTTTIVNNYNNGSGGNNSATPLITVSQTQAGSAEITGIQFKPTSTSFSALIGVFTHAYIVPKTAIHDCWFETGGGSAAAAIYAATNQVLVWNCSFDDTFTHAMAIQPKAQSSIAVTSWSRNSTMGMADVNGATNMYIEDCDFHGYFDAVDFDDGTRTVFRHNVLDNSAVSSHGADTSGRGQRHVEIYDNELIFDIFPGDCGTELAIQHFFWLRGGTAVITDNVLPRISSQCAGNKANILFSVLNTRRNSGPYCCWDTYPAPHQVGTGYGPGAVFVPYISTCGPYIGLSFSYHLYAEPVYIWNNSGIAGSSVSLIEDGIDQCGNGHGVNAWVMVGRDYMIGPKPGYMKFAYPHPLTASFPPPTPTPAPAPTPTPTPTPSATACSTLQQRLDRLELRQERLQRRNRSNPRLKRRIRRLQRQLQHC